MLLFDMMMIYALSLKYSQKGRRKNLSAAIGAKVRELSKQILILKNTYLSSTICQFSWNDLIFADYSP